MEIGILTMHRVVNYGSFMQAYALKKVLESYGHKVDFRDFRPGQPKHHGIKVAKPGVLRKIARIPAAILDLQGSIRKVQFRKELLSVFERHCWPILNVPQASNYSLSADAIVIGSDEVFNYTQNHAFGYVPCLFGHGINAKKIISYAASAGYANADDVDSDGMAEELGEGFRRFSSISVRDQNSVSLVERCIGRSPALVIDPTLLYDFDKEIPSEPVVRGKYLLVYAYEGRMESESEIKAVRDFANKMGLKILSVGFYHAWCDQNIVVTPFELLRVFKDAEFVVTDTFHGSIFAMKTQRSFATLVRESSSWGSNSNKVEYLLRQFGMDSRIVADLSGLGSVLKTPVPYDEFASRHAHLRRQSLDFLESALA